MTKIENNQLDSSEKTISQQAQDSEGKAQKTLESMERRRFYTGKAALLIGFVAIATSCYHLYYAFFHPFFDPTIGCTFVDFKIFF